MHAGIRCVPTNPLVLAPQTKNVPASSQNQPERSPSPGPNAHLGDPDVPGPVPARRPGLLRGGDLPRRLWVPDGTMGDDGSMTSDALTPVQCGALATPGADGQS